MTDRLKTVYPPKTSFCGGYNEHENSELQGFFNVKLIYVYESKIWQTKTSGITIIGCVVYI